MDIATAKLLAAYNKAANEKMNTIILGLDEAKWTREFSGYFKSIKSLCNHLYVTDFVYMKRFSGLRSFKYMENAYFAKTLEFGTNYLGDVRDYDAKRRELDAWLVKFVDELGEADFAATLSYKDSGGNPHKRNFGGLVVHMFNHDTHHRGMVSLYLENLGIENDFNSLSDLL
jgi:uncharacterized damage-inducible protein DinB